MTEDGNGVLGGGKEERERPREVQDSNVYKNSNAATIPVKSYLRFVIWKNKIEIKINVSAGGCSGND